MEGIYQVDEMDLQELRENGVIKNQLKTATQEDFDIIVGDDPYPYAASLFGGYDIALFKRKADCERFIKTYPQAVKCPTHNKSGCACG